MAETLGDFLGHWVAQAGDRPPLRPSPAETLGMRLRRLRKAAGLTLRQAAPQADVSVTNLHQIETGRTASPSVALAWRLARLYGTTVDAIMEGLA